MIIDALLDAVLDSLRALPFLLGAFALVELLERRSGDLADRLFKKFKKAGPLVGAVLGLLPQCGFSAAMSNLYAEGIVSVGTLIAVFLSTSDEAVLIMLSSPDAIGEIAPLLATKFIIALVFGMIIDMAMARREAQNDTGHLHIDCGFHDKKGIITHVLIHTRNVFIWLLIVTFILNLLVESFGSDRLAVLLGSNMVFQPLLTALIGLIPNCAVSVMFTKLYLEGTLSFASTVAGLCSGAGVGLIILGRMVKDKHEVIKIIVILYVCAAVSGMILRLFI